MTVLPVISSLGSSETTDDHILEVEGLTVCFGPENGAVHAVTNVSFRLMPGETLGIIGESGSGKSVTMQTLLGLVPSPPARTTGGRALYKGRDLLALPEDELRRIRGSEIAMIFQDPMSSLNPVLTVGLQLTEALIENEALPRKVAEARALEMLDLVGIANGRQRMASYPHQFSGGQLQRISIAMALVGNPSVLIADEPTTALDVTIQAQIVDLVVRLQNQLGMSVIWISHDLSLVAGFVDRVAVMYAGSIVETASVAQLYAAPSHPYTLGLLRSIPSLAAARAPLVPIPGAPPNLFMAPEFCAFAPRCALASEQCRKEKPPLKAVGKDHASACWHINRLDAIAATAANVPDPVPPATRVLLKVEDLKVHFPIRKGVLRRQVGSVRAVDGVSFEVLEGETLSLVGESGCGKSTTGRAILGLSPVTDGNIIFDDADVTRPTRELAARRRREMQMIFQNPYGSLNPRLTVGRIIGEGLRAQGIGTPQTREARVRELLDLVGLADRMRTCYPFELSGGQRQRVGVARALAAAPRFVIADEPISALDVSIQAQIVNLLEDLKRELRLTYLFIGHDLSMIRHLSDRVAVMYLGRIVEIGATSDVFGRPQHPYTSALLSAIPVPDPAAGGTRSRTLLPGNVPDPSRPPEGCHFHPRCPLATDLCRREAPLLDPRLGGRSDHRAACHHSDKME